MADRIPDMALDDILLQWGQVTFATEFGPEY